MFYKCDLEVAGWLPWRVTVDPGLVAWAGWCRVWVRVLFSYVVYPLSVSIFRLQNKCDIVVPLSYLQFSLCEKPHLLIWWVKEQSGLISHHV